MVLGSRTSRLIYPLDFNYSKSSRMAFCIHCFFFFVKFVFILLAYFNYTIHEYLFVVKYFYSHNFKIPCGHIASHSKQICSCTSQEAESPSLASHASP